MSSYPAVTFLQMTTKPMTAVGNRSLPSSLKSSEKSHPKGPHTSDFSSSRLAQDMNSMYVSWANTPAVKENDN